MKKKILSLLTCMVMIVCLVGCGGSLESKSGNLTKQADASTGDTSGDDEFTVAFMLDSYIDDAGWGYEFGRGMEKLNDAGMKTIYKENVPTTEDCEKVMNDFINQGADVIIGSSFGFMEYMDQEAQANPDVTFLHCGGYLNEENFYNFLGRQYETRFLSGIVAASTSKTGKIGYVASYEMAEVIRQINAFTLGAQIVNPDIEVDVVWTHTWDDASIETQAGQTLIDDGCDVLTCHETTSASLLPAENNENVHVIGYTTDISKLCPTSYLTSSAFDWGSYFVPTCEAIKDGTWEGGDCWWGLKEGVVQLTDYSDAVPQSAKDLVEEYKAKIIDGTYDIFAGPIYGQDGSVVVEDGSVLTDEDLENMLYFVKGVSGKIEQ